MVHVVGAAGVLFSYDVLDKFFDVHSYAGYCFSLFVECLFASLLSYSECLLFATIFVSFKARRHIPKFDKDYIVILGCRMRDDGKPAVLLRSRIDRALEFAKLQKKTVPSGGAPRVIAIAAALLCAGLAIFFLIRILLPTV